MPPRKRRICHTTVSLSAGIDVARCNFLRTAVGWQALPDEQAQAGLNHSGWVIGCWHGDKIVASARILWDKGSIAYLADGMFCRSISTRALANSW